MKIMEVGGQTSVGFQRKIGVEGNCFSGVMDDGSHYWVANIGLESLEACKVPFPIEGEVRDGLFYVTDSRIPEKAYRTGELCFCMNWRKRGSR